MPRTFARTGAIGNFFFIAQWFPEARRAAGRRLELPPVPRRHRVLLRLRRLRRVADRARRLAARRHRRRARAARQRRRHRRRIATTRRTSTTSPGRPAPTTWCAPRASSIRGLPPVEMRLLLQPEHAAQAERHFDATRDDAEVLRRVVRRLPLRPHHHRRSRVPERRRRHGVPDAVHRRHALARAAPA